MLEELINETDRPMFFERVLNSTVRYDSDEGHFFATPQCGNSVYSGPSVGNSGSSGKRAPFFVESTIFDNRAASGVTGMLSVTRVDGTHVSVDGRC